MIEFKIDTNLTNLNTKSELLSMTIASLFFKYQETIDNINISQNFDNSKKLLDLFQKVYSSCIYIDQPQSSKKLSNESVIGDIVFRSTLLNIPNDFSQLLKDFTKFINYKSDRIVFVYDSVDIEEQKITKINTDYLVRSIFNKCNVVRYVENSETKIIIEIGV